MKYQSLLLPMLVALTLSLFSQETKSTFKVEAKPILKVFANYNSNLGGNENVEAFEAMQIKRAYLGYKANLSENYSVKLVIDVGENSGLYRAYLKNAELKYKKEKWTINVGMIATKQFKVQEKFWGYRYLLKSYQDQYKYNASADLGLSADYQITKNISLDAIVQNGLGYKHVLPTGTYRGGLGLSLNYKPILFRVYYDISSKPDVSQQNIATFIGYKFKNKFRIGAEYNYQLNNSFVDNHDLFGFSVYSTFVINSKIEVFARYDKSQSNIVEDDGARLDPLPWNINRDAELGVIGVQYKLLNKIKVSANYRRYLSDLTDSYPVNWIFLNLEFKL